ncbi:uncharacterized protein PFL1_05987 [Pseudozyma flocculosa PF-1]|uniref:Fe2OG dioxygenase domain-containing protein n=2 Tax=Pseudozyma flocculosa TaxID=84751 RepID=A0A5C3F5Y4_9BASI|nr:uncharacterized protein PFL1_05987 [Pseudozyma flocculosa PF-1]EPQ26339.1 hypothetical protein PFL1_05987 [Pseudozyma flocculosa PF-1]SPO39077.1 uncharacterized protein PSFLO_04556 [Pseudozyma flocculosa]
MPEYVFCSHSFRGASAAYREDNGGLGCDCSCRPPPLRRHTEVGEKAGPLHDLSVLLFDDAKKRRDRYSVGGATDLLPASPGLSIDGLGFVALPVVSTADAERLAAVCQQRPTDGRTSLSASPQARPPLRLTATRFSVKNPAWQAGIAQLGRTVAEDMGFPDTRFVLSLQQLVLFRQGDQPHTLHAKVATDQRLATMVVQLPSVHKGGSLVVQHEGMSITHDFGADSGTAPFQCHYAVFYANDKHQFMPVIEGHLLTLVYSVCWPEARPGTDAPVSADAGFKKQVAEALGRLNDEDRPLFYFLEQSLVPPPPLYASSVPGPATEFDGVDLERKSILLAANSLLPQHQRYEWYTAEAELHASLRFFDKSDTASPLSDSYVRLSKLKSEKGLENVLTASNKTFQALWESSNTVVPAPSSDPSSRLHTLPGGAIRKNNVLVAWPKRSEGTLLLSYIGEDAAFHRLVAAGPENDQLVELLEAIKASFAFKAWHPAKSGYRVRHDMLSRLLSRDFDARLFHLYLDMFPRASLLLDDQDGWNDLLRLSRAPKAWDATKGRIAAALSKDLSLAVAVLEKSGDEGSTALAQSAVDGILQRRRFRPSELSDSKLQVRLWGAALALADEPLLAFLVQKHVQADVEALGPCVTALTIAQHRTPAQSQARSRILEPLINGRIEWTRKQQAQLPPVNADAEALRCPWDAAHPNAEVDSFLRSTQRWTRLGNFRSIYMARRLAQEFDSFKQRYWAPKEHSRVMWKVPGFSPPAFTCEAKAFQSGGKFYVDFNKGSEHLQRQYQEHDTKLQALKHEETRLLAMFPADEVEGQGRPPLAPPPPNGAEVARGASQPASEASTATSTMTAVAQSTVGSTATAAPSTADARGEEEPQQKRARTTETTGVKAE